MPVPLQTVKPAADRANPRIGVGALAFSPDSSLLATRNGQCRAVRCPLSPSVPGTLEVGESRCRARPWRLPIC